MKEEWKDIEGFEGYYQVSNLGRVKSIDREIVYKDGRTRHQKGRILKPHKNSEGYCQIILSKNGYTTHYSVNRLVLQTFALIENNQRFEADHINRNPSDNRLENLRWLTTAENQRRPKRGKTVCQYDGDELVEVFPSAHEAERKTGISNSSIIKCCKGKAKTAGGFAWKYYD